MVISASAAGVLSLLDEPNNDLKIYALKELDSIVDLFWAEIADQITKIEILYEDKNFSERHLAALVASKVYYHLAEYDESLTFALGAGSLFDLNRKTEYVETLISIDKYIEKRNQQLDDPSVVIDKGLEEVVQRMFGKCFDSKEYQSALGIAMDSLRLDMIEFAITKGDSATLLAYVLESAMTIVQNLVFRNKVLNLLVKLYEKLAVPDYISITQCFVHLNDPFSAAELLKTLASGSEDDQLTAFQIAFDIEDNATQEFSSKVKAALPTPEPEPEANAMEVDEEKAPLLSSPTNWVVVGKNSPIAKLHEILSGSISIKLYLEFLFKNNNTDILILKNTKNAFDSRNSAHHSAITFANAFSNAGTTSDEFLRQSLEWLSRANNWTKFSATAALGVIHKGHLSQATALLAPYLPQEGVSGSAYSEGGALFALGLIHANHGTNVLPTLTKALTTAQSEVLQHGAALGLGVAGMATGNEEIYEALKTVLFNDSAVAGEAAGLAMGLVMLGTGMPRAVEEMLQYAHDTQHEKIIRGLSLGLAMLMFGREEAADAFIEQLCGDKDPILRYGGMYTVAMAYAGTGNNKAIKRLLHVAVSDVNDDVRRAAVTGLGFLLFKTPQHVPRIVQLLSESYNPHVRYGATLALGISCAGTALNEAIEILEPMTKDNVDYVRQGALIALGMILVQHNEQSCQKAGTVRKLYETIIADKREDMLARLGATLGQGIIDAGGRNVTISLASRSGYANIPAIVGMAVFTQFWYWYPLAHFLSLSFNPTGIIALNKNLDAPHFQLLSNARPSLFAYPPATKPPTTETVEKVATAVLSTTVKSKARQKKTKDAMEVDEEKKEKEPEQKEEKKPKKKEDQFQVLDNFSRIVQAQEKYIAFQPDSRYTPIKKQLVGIVLLKDNQPGQPESLIASAMNATKDASAPSASTN
ncbi:proteasome regulatory particle base subunit [Terramyces sp. JEL0728]|nr:proteasome regulatory particle base subunit [Terramyces sp. JEL0728]